jgi:predicted TIM-barrel fold metal-dependent hydrolase
MFYRQCFFTSWYDKIAPFADYIGADHVLWSANFPLTTSTWPRTQETIERCLAGVSKEEREKILWRNAAALYRLT